MKRKIRIKWPIILLVQAASMLAVSVLIALSYYAGSLLHAILFWGGLSIAGMFSACFATCRGLLNYAAWILPPAMGLLGHWLVWNYFPGAGPIFLCAFISLVGAAAGEVIKREQKKKKRLDKGVHYGKELDSHL